MSKTTNPAQPEGNDEKFKPAKVADESAGNVTNPGRSERDMKDLPRGSENDTRGASRNRT